MLAACTSACTILVKYCGVEELEQSSKVTLCGSSPTIELSAEIEKGMDVVGSSKSSGNGEDAVKDEVFLSP